MKNSIYFRFAGPRYGGSDVPVTWYKIDTSLAEPHTTFVSHIPVALPLPTNAVALGSVVYVLGYSSERIVSGSESGSREVYYLDTALPNPRWRKAPSLNRPRAGLCLVAKNGKIYAVGHEESYSYREKAVYDRESWCEVFDPLLNCWKLLSGPGDDTLAKGGGGGVDTVDGVIVEATQGRFWYDVHCNTWKMLHRLQCTTRCDGAIIDGIEYYFFRRVHGHNLGKVKGQLSFHRAVKGLERRGVSPELWETDGHGSPNANYPTAFVVGVGDGRLCLVHETDRGLHCTRFRVSLHCDEEEECELVATIEAFRVYPDHRYDPYNRIFSGKPQLKLCLVI